MESEAVLGVGLALFGFFSSITAAILKFGNSKPNGQNGYTRESTCLAYREGQNRRFDEVDEKFVTVFKKLDEMTIHIVDLAQMLADTGRRGKA